MNLLRQITAVGLVGFLLVTQGKAQSFELKQAFLFGLPAVSQAPGNANSGASKGPVVRKLRIMPLEGQGTGNIITARTPTPIVVAVLDENDRPVEGVSVTFQLPTSGPGGVFANGETTYSGVTDSRGQVGVLDFQANDKPGRFDVRVTAKYQELMTTLIMQQRNYFTAEDRAKSEPKPLLKNWKFYAVVGGIGAGVIAAILLTRSDPAPIAVSAGPVSFIAR